MDFPLAGAVCRVDYGDLVVEQDFRTPGAIAYRVVSGEAAGFSASVPLTVTMVRDDVFVLSFTDPLHVGVVVQDLAAREVTAFMVSPGLEVRRLVGKLIAA